MNDPIRFTKHIEPHICKLAVPSVKSSHVRAVLDQGKEQGKSRKSLVHLRPVMNLIFASLWQDEVIPENPVARVKVPNVLTDKRQLAVLTDEELVRYLGWQHPEEHYGMAVLERQFSRARSAFANCRRRTAQLATLAVYRGIAAQN